MKLLHLLTLTIFCLSEMSAQESEPVRYLPFSIGLVHYQSKDEYHSPLRYRGYGMMAGMGYERRSEDQFLRHGLQFASAGLTSKAPNPSSLRYMGVGYRGHSTFQVASLDTRDNWFVGFTLKISGAGRQRESSSQFDLVGSLGITAAVTYVHQPTDRWHYDGVLSIPLLGWGVRPRYAAPTYEKPGGDFWKPRHFFLYFPNLLDLDAAVNADWQMNNGNALRLGYQWRFYQILDQHRLRVMEQSLSFSPLLRL